MLSRIRIISKTRILSLSPCPSLFKLSHFNSNQQLPLFPDYWALKQPCSKRHCHSTVRAQVLTFSIVSCAHPKSARNPEAGLLKLLVNYVLGTPQMQPLYPSRMQAAVLGLRELQGKAAAQGAQTGSTDNYIIYETIPRTKWTWSSSHPCEAPREA